MNGIILWLLPEGEDAMKVTRQRTWAVLAMANKIYFVTKRRGKHSGSSSEAQLDMLISKK